MTQFNMGIRSIDRCIRFDVLEPCERLPVDSYTTDDSNGGNVLRRVDIGLNANEWLPKMG